jgi:putative peptidoglycan lipid II flippase
MAGEPPSVTGAERIEANVRRATFVWMGSILLSRILGFFREIVIARAGGANAATDVYFAAFTIPDFVNYLLAGGAISITFIPVFARYAAGGDEEEGWRVFSIVTSFIGVAVGGAILAAMLLADRLAPWVAPGFSPAQQHELARLTRIVLPAQLFLFEGFLLSAVQQAKGATWIPALAPLLYNGGTILGGLLLAPRMGMEGFCWGLLGGAVAGSFVLQLWGARLVGMRWRFSLAIGHPGFRRYFRLSLPIMLGQSIVVWDEWIARWFGSGLAAATISWLAYGRKLASVPQAVFGQAAGIASFPRLARQAAERKVAEMVALVVREGRFVLVASSLSTILLVVLGEEICRLLLRSRLFGEESVRATGLVLAIFAFAIAAWSLQALLQRAFYAFEDTLTPTIAGTILTVAAIPFYALLGRTMGYRGLALASVASALLYTVALVALLARRFRREGEPLPAAELRSFVARLVGVSLLAALLAFGVRFLALRFVPFLSNPEGWMASLGRTILAGAIGTAAFLGLGARVGLREATELVVSLLSRVVGRGRAEGLLARAGIAP